VNSSTGASTRSGVVWSSVAFAGTKILSFASTAVLARLLTPDDFGVVAAVLVFIGFIELGGDLGMRSTVVYEQEQGISRRVQTAFTVNLVLIAILTALGILLAAPVAAFFGMADDVGLSRLACLAMPLRAFGNIADSLLLRELAFKQRIVPEVGSSLVKAVVSIVMAIAGMEATSLVVGVLAGNLVWSAMQWGLTGFRPTFGFDRAIARSMASYGGMAALLEILSVLANRVDTIVIGRIMGERALGLYTVAVRVPELAIDSVNWTVSRVAFPALSRSRAQAENTMHAVALGLIRYQTLYAVPAAVGAAVLAGPLLTVLFGEVWSEAAGVLAALAAMTASRALAFPIGDAFKAMGRPGVLVAANLAQVPAVIAGMIVAAPHGITAVAWVRGGLGIVFSLTLVVLARLMIDIPLRGVVRAAGPSLVAGAGVLLGTGVVRLLAPEEAVLPLLAGIVAGTACGLAGLALFARPTLLDVWSALAPKRLRRGVRA
jgi:lipopolysaccharide exporter